MYFLFIYIPNFPKNYQKLFFQYGDIFPIFKKNSINIFLPIHFVLGIVPPFYEKYDKYREGGYGGGGVYTLPPPYSPLTPPIPFKLIK
jgi:hypothetical protein